VAPDFLLARGGSAALSRVSSGADTPEGEAVVHRSADGRLAIVSRVFAAGHADYGIDGDGPLRDGSGRTIRFTEGLVLQGEPGRITTADLARAHAAVTEPYQRFWMEEDRWQTAPSTGFPLGTSAGQTVHLRYAQDWSAPQARKPLAEFRKPIVPRRLLVGLGVVVVVSVGALGALAALRPGNTAPPPASPAPTVVTSAAPLTTPVATAECDVPGKSCLVDPADLAAGMVTMLEFANAITAHPSPDCRNGHGSGLQVAWGRTGPGSLRLDWAAAPGGRLDLTARTEVDLLIQPEGGVDGLQLVITDAIGAQGTVPVRLIPNVPGIQTVRVPLAGVQGVNRALVRSVALRWPQGRVDGAGMCFAGMAFR